MKTIWTSNLKDQQDIERFKLQLRSSKTVLERLDQILDERLKAVELIETSSEIYKQPGWSGAFASYHGERRALNWLKKLLDQKESNERNEFVQRPD